MGRRRVGLVFLALLTAGVALAAEVGVEVTDGQLVCRAAAGTILIRSLTYEARDAAGLALQTSRVVADGPAPVRAPASRPTRRHCA